MRIRRSCLVAAIVGLATITGCDEDGTSEEREDEVFAAAEEGFTNTDPETCTDSYTDDFREQTSYSSGSQALALCELTLEQGAADSVEVSEVEAGEDKASAVINADGGATAGLEVEVELVREDTRWKLDAITDATLEDRDAFLEAQFDAIQQPPTSFSDEQAQCAIDAIDASDEEIEEAIVAGDPTPFLGSSACGDLGPAPSEDSEL